MNTKKLFINLTDPAIFQSFGGEEYWEVLEVPNGTVVVKEGENSTDFYYVFSGHLDVHKAKNRLASLVTGDFFGEGSLLSDKERGATVETLEDTKLLKLSQANFEKLVRKDPEAAISLILGIVKVLNKRLQETNNRLVTLGHIVKSLGQRGGDFSHVVDEVFSQLKDVTHHANYIFFDSDGVEKYKTAHVTKSFTSLCAMEIADVSALFKDDPSLSSTQKENRLYAVVRDSGGALGGFLVAEVCALCVGEEAPFVETVAKQFGLLFS